MLMLVQLVCNYAYSIIIKNIDDEIIWLAASYQDSIIAGPWKLRPGESIEINEKLYPEEAIIIFRPKKHNFYGIWWENQTELNQNYTVAYNQNDGVLEVQRLL